MGRRTTGFRGFTGNLNKKPPTKVNRPGASSKSSGYLGEGSDFGGKKSGNTGGGNQGDNNSNRGYVSPKKDNEENKSFIQKFFDKGKAENQIKGEDFATDLKKASKYLYTQHPYAKELMAKYNLDEGDIVNLRIGMTQPGFHGKIGEVYNTKVRPTVMPDFNKLNLMNLNPDYVRENYFEEGMKMSDTSNPYQEGSFKAYMTDKVQDNLFFSGINSLFGSPTGQQGYYFAQEKFPDLSNDELKNYAAAVANNPELYNNMMETPIMQDYKFNEFLTGTQRDLRQNKDRGIMNIPVVEPAPYDFVKDSPYFN